MEVHKSKGLSNELKLVMFPWFAFGHINPFVQLSNKLSAHGIRISFLSIPGNISRIKSSLKPSPLAEIIPLDIPPVEGLLPDFDSSSELSFEKAELLKGALDKMQPQVEAILAQIRPHVVIFDFAQYWLPELASKWGIKAVHFSVFSAISSYLTVPARMTNPDEPPSVEELKKPPSGFPDTAIISMKTFQARDFQYIFKSFHGGPPVFKRVLEILTTSDAILYKSCNEIEGPYIKYLSSQFGKPILLAGTAIPLPPTGVLEQKWETWLSTFSEKSVIFCNFGSETYLNDAQIEELSLGLELTGMPFFLVLNFGVNSTESQAKLESTLPEGFQERVKGRGVVHTGWVQQQHILAHTNIGCYVNHSGFSSVIEAIVNDCQLVCVPQKGDQFFNSALLCDDLKAGVEVSRRDEDGFFGKEDVFEAVKTVMVYTDDEPGLTIRANHEKWRKFLLNKEVEDQYVVNLVKELGNLAFTQA